MYSFENQEQLEKEYYEKNEQYQKCNNCSGEYFNEISFGVFVCCDCEEIITE